MCEKLDAICKEAFERLDAMSERMYDLGYVCGGTRCDCSWCSGRRARLMAEGAGRRYGPEPSAPVPRPTPPPSLPPEGAEVDACVNILNLWNEAHTEAKAKAEARKLDPIAAIKALAARS